jgi:hypothetical protein
MPRLAIRLLLLYALLVAAEGAVKWLGSTGGKVALV